MVIANPTDYGVLIWNSWTDESITVDMYSTKNVEVIIEEPTEKPFNECTRVTTERIRRWSGGSDESDYFYATYRPKEGLNCDGTPSDPDQTTTTTTIPDEPVTDEDTGDHSSIAASHNLHRPPALLIPRSHKTSSPAQSPKIASQMWLIVTS